MLNTMGHSRYNTLAIWLVIGISAAFYSYDILLRIAPSVMKYDLMSHYGISSTKLSTISSMYFLIYAPMQLPVGMLMDRYGPRLLLTLSGLSCAVGIAILSLTHWVWLAMLSRALIGLGSSFAFVGVLKLGSVLLPPNRFAFLSGLTLALGMLGATLGDIIISHLLAIESWQAVCIQAALMGVILTSLMWIMIPSDVEEHSHGETPEDLDFYQILQGKLELIKNPQVWLAALVASLSYTPVTLFSEHFGIEFLQLKYQISHIQASTLNSYVFIGWMLGGPLVSSVSDYFQSRKWVVLTGLSISLVACIGMIYLPIPIHWMPALMICFGIVNSVQIILFPVVKEIAGKAYTGIAISFVNMICMFSGLLQGMIGYLYDQTKLVLIHTHQPENMDIISFRVAYITLPIFLLCAIICLLWMKETYEAEALDGEPCLDV